MREKFYKSLAKFVLWLHNFSYKLASKLAIRAEEGLHPKHRLMGYHKFFVDNIGPNDVILDIGCGEGALTFDLSKKAKKVVGIDISKRNINEAKEKSFAPNIEYLIGNAINYEFNQKFNVVVMSNVLEHIENRTKFLQKTKSLAPKILIRVPMINRDWIILYKKELGVEWRLDKAHFIEYTLDSFQEELERAGLKFINYTIQFGEIWAVVK